MLYTCCLGVSSLVLASPGSVLCFQQLVSREQSTMAAHLRVGTYFLSYAHQFSTASKCAVHREKFIIHPLSAEAVLSMLN